MTGDAPAARPAHVWQRWWLLPLLTLAVFAPSLGGAAVYDDELNFERHAALREGHLLGMLTEPFFRPHLAYWRPLTELVAGAAWQGGMPGVHAAALGVHALAVLAAHALARRLLRDPRGAFAAAALFAVHPLHVESVAWASALAEPLAGLFALLALGSLLRWLDEGTTRWPWRTALALLAALLAKETAVSALLLALLLPVAARPRHPARWVRSSATVVAIGAAWLALRSLVLERPLGGGAAAAVAEGATWATGAVEMLLRSLVLLVAPWPLTPFRSLHSATHAEAPALLVPALLVGAALALASAWLVSRLRPLGRTALLLVLVPLLLPAAVHPTLGEHPLADRYLYLPTLGAALALGVAVRGGGAATALGVVVAVLATLTFVQCRVWRSTTTLVAHGLAHTPAEPIVHVLAGNLELQAHRSGDESALARARAAYERAVALAASRSPRRASDHTAAALAGVAWCELLAQQAADRVDAPALVARFRAALALDASSVSTWIGLGTALALAAQPDAALAAFGEALVRDPYAPEAWFNLGLLQLELGRPVAARRTFERALECYPHLDAARDQLARWR